MRLLCGEKTITEIAADTGLCYTHLAAVIRGDRRPGQYVVDRLAAYWGITSRSLCEMTPHQARLHREGRL